VKNPEPPLVVTSAADTRSLSAVADCHSQENENRTVTHGSLQHRAQVGVIYLQHATDKWNYQEYPQNRNPVGPTQLHNDIMLFTKYYSLMTRQLESVVITVIPRAPSGTILAGKIPLGKI
jgi:hypothetical protein